MGFFLQKTSKILKFEFLNIDASGCITVVIWNAADFLSVDIGDTDTLQMVSSGESSI
jgi:hypothetical protein